MIEADEYDTAFFDKRSKFLHYRPRTLILNNLEFDHADIFADLAAIETQCHHLVRTLPAAARIVANAGDEAIARVLQRGCWSELKHSAKVASGGSIASRHLDVISGDSSSSVRCSLQWPGTITG